MGGIRDFNRIEVDGLPPDALEKNLSGFEGQVAKALNDLQTTRSLDDKITFAVIMNLIALVAVRNPQTRHQWSDFQSEVHKKMLGLTLATEERWKSTARRMKEDGIDIDENVTFAQMREFYERDEYNIVTNREHHITIELEGINTVLPFLFNRNWTLLIASDDAGPFVTSDRPVALTWKHPENVPPIFRESPGFGMQDTRIVFPVGQDMTLIGEFNNYDNCTAFVERKTVAVVNSQIILFAISQVYAPHLNFNWLDSQGELKDGRALLSYVRSMREKAAQSEAQYEKA